jgi:peptidoglycan/LPS O-acetylase OafA/YrhL
MTTNTVHGDYRADIDGLRAVAVLSVLGFHSFPTAVPSGFMGVDIFFVISGFLISTIILNDLIQGSFSFLDFYSRRIKRIFPALLLVLACSFVIGWFVLLPDELKELGKHITTGAGFGSNFVLLRESGYFDNLSEAKPLLHLWSLGIEEQFYFVWPFLLYLTWKSKKNFLLVIFILLLISFTLNVGRIHHHAISVFYSPQSRFWELLIGAALAGLMLGKSSFCFWLSSQNHARQTTRNVLSFCGAVLLAVGYSLLTKDKRFPGWWALLPTLGAALMIAAGSRAWLNRVLLSNRFLVWIGLISFPLYLWHWPLLSFARIMQNETPSPEIRVVALLLSAVLAWLTFVLVEKPIRHGRRHDVNSKKFNLFGFKKPTILMLLMLLTGLVGYNAYSRDGYRFRASFKKFVQQNNGFNWDDAAKYANAAKDDPPNFKRDVMLIGDSHAQAIFGGFSELFKKHNTRLQLRAGAACPPFYDLTVQHIGHEEECKDVMNGFLDEAIKDNSIKTVILTSRGPLYLTGQGFGDGDAIFLKIKSKFVKAKSDEDYTDVFADAMTRTLNMLTNTNKKIIFIVDAPEMGFAPELCVDVRPFKLIDNKKTTCGIQKEVFDKRNASYLTIIAAQARAFPQVKFLYPSKYLCDDQFCYAKKDGIIFYRDDDHLSYEGGLRIGQFLENDIFQ